MIADPRVIFDAAFDRRPVTFLLSNNRPFLLGARHQVSFRSDKVRK